MIIKIEIDTREDLNERDRALLSALAGDETPAPAAAAPAAAAPAKKTAAKKAAAAPEPTPEPAADAAPDSDVEALREAVSARASDLLSSGERDRVIAALAGAGGGAGRVGEVTDENLQAFLNALTD